MTELMKRYERETGNSAIDPHEWECYGHEGEKFHSYAFTAWLAKQLTWRPVSEKPEVEGRYLVVFKDKQWPFFADYKNCKWSAKDVTHWLPIPKMEVHS